MHRAAEQSGDPAARPRGATVERATRPIARTAATSLVAVAISFPGIAEACADGSVHALALGPGSVPAPVAAPPAVDRALIARLLDWVAVHTDYDVSATRRDPPEIAFCEVGDPIAYEGDSVVVEPGLEAAYDVSARRIHLVGAWDPDDPRDRSALLHELIHDVQFSNRAWYCPEKTEWEAYRLQDAWLAERGEDSGFDWLHVYLLSRCPRDHHP